MDISGGPMLVQGTYDSNRGGNRSNDVLFNYDANFRVLDRKSYAFTVFLRRDHPEVTTGILGRFLTTIDDYGVQGAVRPGFLPSALLWDASHRTSKGSGFGSTLDESVDRVSLRTSIPYKSGQSVSVNFDWNERQSASGSEGLPIQEALIETFNTRIDGRNAFGAQSRFVLNQYVNLLKQNTETDEYTSTEDFQYAGHFRWAHSDRMNSYSSYRYKDQERTNASSRSQEFVVGTSFQANENLSFTGDGRVSRFDDGAFSRGRANLQGSARYTVPLSVGSLGLNGSLGFDRTDQDSTSDSSRKFDEPHVLVGIVPVPLDEQFIVASTVTVTNVPQTQTFVEDIDYRLVTIGGTTTIERIVTGNIFDGQEVLVSYEYLTGGTTEYETSRQSISANLSFLKNANVYVRLDKADNTILSGLATNPLNDYKRYEIGGRLTVPIKNGWSLGGEARYTDNDEDISPSVRTTYDLFVQSGNYRGLRVRLGAYKEIVDYEFSQEDVDMLRYVVSASLRLPGASSLSYRFNQGKDDGGTVSRKDKYHSLQFNWRYRKLMFSLRANQSDVSQSAVRRRDTQVTADLRRRF
jgi:hypothetical protein